jgi:hypothetical protein
MMTTKSLADLPDTIFCNITEYLDWGDVGRLDNAVAPTYIKVTTATGTFATAIAEIRALSNDTIVASAGNYGSYTLVGTSRIDGKMIFKVNSIDAANANVDADIKLAFVGLTHPCTAGDAELVKGLEDHIPGFTGNDTADLMTADPYTRLEGEETADRLMGLSLFSKSVEAKTIQVAAAVTREQVQDLKQFGVDAIAQVESVLVNELTQTINKHILGRMRTLAVLNTEVIGTLNLTLAGGIAYGGETRAESHRRILTNILAAANLIANTGRRGAGNFAVVGAKVASALQGIAGFVPNPMANTFNQVAGAIYPVGSVAGINVYTDPNLAFAETQILVGRKGDGNGPGLVFMPYLMAESVQAIVEGTMAPKVAVKTRYALVDAGFHPQTQYQVFTVTGLEL